jgi:threonine dehydratase
MQLPTYDDVIAAAARLEGHAHRTPVLRSTTANERWGAQFFFKCENFQRMGAFKFRGAFNALSKFDAAQRKGGVIAFSSGNHAQAIALSARLLGDAGRHRHAQGRAGRQGGRHQGLRRRSGDVRPLHRRPRGDDQAARAGARHDADSAVRPPRRARRPGHGGQGTDRGNRPARPPVRVPGRRRPAVGSALSARALSPDCKVYGVEPEAGNDGQQSFRTGKIVHIETPKTIADGAQTQHLGEYTFGIIRRDVDDIFTVTDAQLVEAMRFFAERMKMVVEPTGCLAFAGAIAAGKAIEGQRVGIVISGGNVDLSRFAALIAPQ